MSYAQYFNGLFEQLPSNNSVANITAPTFAGVSSVTANNDGSVTINWALATGSAATPIRYKVYIALGASVPAATLFVGTNIAQEAQSTATFANVFQLGDRATYLVNGQAYTVGVRAFSATNVTETNTVTANVTAIASGNIGGVIQATAVSLASSATSLAATNTSLAAALVTLGGYITTFGTQLTTMATNNTNAAANNSAMAGYLTTLSSYLSTLNGYLATFSTNNSNAAANNTAMAGYLTTFATDLGTLASNLATFSTSNTTFANSLATFATDLTNLATQITSLTASATSISSSATSIASSASALASTASALATTATLLSDDEASIAATASELATTATTLAAIVVQITPTKNTALNGFEFLMTDSQFHNPLTGLVPTIQVSKDGSGFAAVTNTPTEVGDGIYSINFSATDMNGNTLVFMFSATGADTRFVTILTQV